MKFRTSHRLTAFIILTMIVAMLISACGAEEGDYAIGENAAVSDNYVTDLSDSSSSESGSKQDSKSDLNQRKIIETMYYSVETKTFDEFTSTLESQALKVGGYVEQSDISGNSYEFDTLRYATFVFRIPNDKVQEFTDFVVDNSTITDRSVTTEDVTLDYVDAESRIKALKTEKEALEALLANAKSTAEILEIRDMLTDVIYEIESYESKLRTYDNLIDYTSITVDVDEVEQTTIVHKQTTWERIKTNLVDNTVGLWNFLVELFVAFVSALPILLFIALIAFIIFLIVRLAVKKSAKKKKINPIVPNPYQSVNTINQQFVNSTPNPPVITQDDKQNK